MTKRKHFIEKLVAFVEREYGKTIMKCRIDDEQHEYPIINLAFVPEGGTNMVYTGMSPRDFLEAVKRIQEVKE